MRQTRAKNVPYGQVWPTLAEKYELNFTPDGRGSGTISGLFKEWPITISPRARFQRPGSFVKIDMAVANPQDCYFTLRSGFRTSILKRYRAKGIDTGDNKFDQQFLLKGDPEPLVKLTFKSVVLRRALLKARWMGSMDIKLYEKNLAFVLKDQGSANVRHLENYLNVLSQVAAAVDALPPLLSLTE